MPKKTKPKAECDWNTPLTPITAKERRKLDKSIKKKYDRFRRRYPEVHGRVVDFITHSIEDGTLYLCFRQLDLAPFDRFIWPHLLVNPLSAPGRSEALRRPKGAAFRA
jgi:hypothetical protein